MYTPRLIGVGACSALVVAAIAAAGAGASTGRALAGSVCVGTRPACLATIQAALDAARDGDTIKIGPGTFAGGIAIDKNVHLKGSGASATVISGGGPVLTIGVMGAPSEPTVWISGVTITGGVNTANLALGGGVYVPASSGGLGATVTITDTVVTGNRAAPATSIPSRLPCGAACPFARGSGGGIDNAGTMTLKNVQVTNNAAGSAVASDADGGGVMNERQATLVLVKSVVSGNVARVTPPNGRFGEGGGVFTRAGSTLTIDRSSVNGNSVEFSTSFPADVPDGVAAQAGGIKIGGDESTLVAIRNSTIMGNSVLASSSGGDLTAFGGGVDDDGALTLSDSTISDNLLSATGVGSVFLDSGGIEVEGPATISNTRLTGNSVTATAPTGTALAQAGAILTATDQAVTISDSLVGGNIAKSTTSTGEAFVQGAGILNAGTLELRSVQVSNNDGSALGPSGSAQGGGIWNSAFPDGPLVQLTLQDSNVTRNSLTASGGLATQGAGLYTTFPVTLTNSRISRNSPDDCFGC
jgi:hypothetical protein